MRVSDPNGMTASQSPPKWLGSVNMLVGGLIMAVATGLIPAPEESFHAPRWVLFLCGTVFTGCGGIVLTYDRPKFRHGLAMLIILCLGTIGLWVSLYGDAAQFRSNVPTSPETTVNTARIAFGIGGGLCYLLVAWTTARAIWRRGQM